MRGTPTASNSWARGLRALNDVILERQPADRPDRTVRFVCECGRPDCTAAIELTAGEFANFSRDFCWFVVAEGHDQ